MQERSCSLRAPRSLKDSAPLCDAVSAIDTKRGETLKATHKGGETCLRSHGTVNKLWPADLWSFFTERFTDLTGVVRGRRDDTIGKVTFALDTFAH